MENHFSLSNLFNYYFHHLSFILSTYYLPYMSDYLVCSGENVMLPGQNSLQKATIIVDKSSGKIVNIRHTRPTSLEQLSNEFAPKTIQWVDVGDKVILPGLVE